MTPPEPLLGLSQRLPPANIEAEQALLGAILANNKAFDRVGDFLRPEHFADDVHGRIYAAIVKRIEAGRLVDAVSLRHAFAPGDELHGIGDGSYLSQLLGAFVGLVNAGEYGRLIHDCWLRRQLLDVGAQMVERAFGADPELDAAAQRDAADAALAALAEQAAGGAVMDMSRVAGAAMDGMLAAIDRGGGLVGVTTGLRALDRMTGGLRPGQLVVIGARASMGKTALGARLAWGAANAGVRVLFVTIEMPPDQIAARMLAGVADLDLSVVLRGLAPDPQRGVVPLTRGCPEVAHVAEHARRLGQLPITWFYQGAPTTAQIRGHARGVKRRPGLDLIVVDYLGRCRPSAGPREANRVQEVGAMARDFKQMAVDLGVPVVLLSQLSRAVETREDQRPRLSDLRESGEIEQEADLVALLYREHYYLVRNKPTRKQREKTEEYELRVFEWQERVRRAEGRAELDIAKHRQGPVGPVRLLFRDRSAWFADETEETQETEGAT